MRKQINRKWYLADARNRVLGRLATEIAKILQGKNLANYEPHKDMGQVVVVINAKDVKLTGKKATQKEYRHHTGYLGGLKTETFQELIKTKPEEVIKRAVWNMLPKNKLRKKRILRLKIYAGSEHPHQAQKLEEI